MYIHRFRSADIGFFLEYIRLYSGYTGFYLEHLDEFFFQHNVHLMWGHPTRRQ